MQELSTTASSITALHCTSRLLTALLKSGRATSRIEPLQSLLAALKLYLSTAVPNSFNKDKDYILQVIRLLGIALRCAPYDSMSMSAMREAGEGFSGCLMSVAKLALVSFHHSFVASF